MASNTPEPSPTIDPPSSTPSTLSTSTTSSSSSSSTTTTSTPSSHYVPALTTLWTRPETCAYTYDADNIPEGGYGPTAYLDWSIDENASTFSCYPPGMFESGNSGTFSPASCPFSWYTVDTTSGAESSKPETTTRTCCSKQYTLNGGFCEKAVPTVVATPVTYLSRESATSYMTQTTTYLVNATIAHHPIIVQFQEKDQDILGLVDDDLAHSDSDSSSSSSSSSSGDLPLGARVGIGLGVAAAVSIIVCFAYYLLRRKRHMSEKAAALQMAQMQTAHGDSFARDAACRSSVSSSALSHDEAALARRGDTAEGDPPPAYEPSPRQLSPTGDLADGAGPGAESPPGSELSSLRAQQEAIRQRILELERSGERIGDDRV